MTKEIAEVLGAFAAAFVGTILVDMWLGGGLLAGFAPGVFEKSFPGTKQVNAAGGGSSGAPPAGTSGGASTGGVATVAV